MKKEFVEKMKKELIAQRDQIIASMNEQSQQFKNLMEDGDAGDEADVAAAAIERNMLDSIGAQDSERLQLITNALTRITQGKYGICLQCGEEISEGRLKALPYAFMCIDCKTEAERRNR